MHEVAHRMVTCVFFGRLSDKAASTQTPNNIFIYYHSR